MRVLALVWVLGAQTRLSILFLGAFGTAELRVLEALGVRATLILGPSTQHPDAERSAVEHACSASAYDVCFIERFYLHHVRSAIPASCRTVLDTHDLMSRRAESRRALGLSAGDTTLQGELDIFSEYDRVLLIQEDELATVAHQLGERAMLVPHPVQFPQRHVVAERRRLGFVASRYEANVDGLAWFLDFVWPSLRDLNAEFHVFGTVCDVFPRPDEARIERRGFVPDFNAVWGDMDIAINPVRWGSGLKIKNVEALANGLPLVTTSHAAGGLTDGAGQAFLVADTATAFETACRTLLTQPRERAILGLSARAFVQHRFSVEACFGRMMHWVLNP